MVTKQVCTNPPISKDLKDKKRKWYTLFSATIRNFHTNFCKCVNCYFLFSKGYEKKHSVALAVYQINNQYQNIFLLGFLTKMVQKVILPTIMPTLTHNNIAVKSMNLPTSNSRYMESSATNFILNQLNNFKGAFASLISSLL